MLSKLGVFFIAIGIAKLAIAIVWERGGRNAKR
jgi:hypothetical protein